jgi:hypothetical protein
MRMLTVMAMANWSASEKGYKFCPVSSSSTTIAESWPGSVPGVRVLWGLGAGAAPGAMRAADRLGNIAEADPTRLSVEKPSEDCGGGAATGRVDGPGNSATLGGGTGGAAGQATARGLPVTVPAPA